MFKILKINIIILVLISCTLISCSDRKNNISTTEVKETESNVQNNVITPFSIFDIEDAFGDKTGKKMIAGLFKGKFTNSATNNSVCYFNIGFVDQQLRLAIFEYGKYQKTGTNNFRIEYKDDEGNKYETYGHYTNLNNIWTIGDSNFRLDQVFLGKLLTSKNIKVYMVNDRALYETYSFEIDTKNFKEHYNTLYK